MLLSGEIISVVETLLERGYSVRGTVRSEEKGRYLEEYSILSLSAKGWR